MILDILILLTSIMSFLIGAWAAISIIGWVHGLFEMYKIEQVSVWQKVVQCLITPFLIGLNILLALGFLIAGLYGLYLLAAVYALDMSFALLGLSIIGVMGIILATVAVLDKRSQSGVTVDAKGIDFKKLYEGPLSSKPQDVHMHMQKSLLLEKNKIARVDFVKAKPPLWELLFDPASQKDIIIVQTKDKKYYAKTVPIYDAHLIERDLKKIYKV